MGRRRIGCFDVWLTQAFGIAVCCALMGCQNRTPAPASPKNSPAAVAKHGSPSEAAVSETEEKPADQSEASAAPPVAAVERVLNGVDAGRLEAIADFLPEPYQQDVNAVVRTMAEKLPDELWTRLHSIAEKAAAVLKKTPQENAENQVGFEAALDALTAPEAWDREGWRQFEVRAFLKGPASDAFAAWRKLSPANGSPLTATKVELVEQAGRRAVLKLQSPFDAKPREVPFVERDGKWIPEGLAEHWEQSVGTIARRLKDVDPQRMMETAAKLQPMLLQIEHTLDQMLASGKPEAIQLGWYQIQSLLEQGREALTPAGPPPRIAIRLVEAPSDKTLDELLDQLVQATGHPAEAEYLMFPTTTGMMIYLSPIDDFADFVRRLTFVRVKSQDEAERSVEIEIPQ
jgi:hypothetical protein